MWPLGGAGGGGETTKHLHANMLTVKNRKSQHTQQGQQKDQGMVVEDGKIVVNNTHQNHLGDPQQHPSSCMTAGAPYYGAMFDVPSPFPANGVNAVVGREESSSLLTTHQEAYTRTYTYIHSSLLACYRAKIPPLA
jgi:hypothetical protein